MDFRQDRCSTTCLRDMCRFEEFPSLIAYASDASEVPALIQCAKGSNVKAVPRNGGHQ